MGNTAASRDVRRVLLVTPVLAFAAIVGAALLTVVRALFLAGSRQASRNANAAAADRLDAGLPRAPWGPTGAWVAPQARNLTAE